MIAEIGHFFLLMALACAVVQGIGGLFFTQPASVQRASWAHFFCVSAAFVALTYCYIVSDFSVLNVAANSHSHKPLLYKITGVWGNHEGSLLLWAGVLAGFGAWLARYLPQSLLFSKATAVQGLIACAFLIFIIFTSNPFERLADAPLEGRGLNPILQDPALAIHPPLLYVGYVGFSAVFSLAIAALLCRMPVAQWAGIARPWILVAWAFLTAGITLGSWWAFYELGWGGWWFWDPVENASLLPWLLGTALLHSVIASARKGIFPAWTLLLAILTFCLSLLGAFLVRSGVLTSVHTFANDPARGVFLLLILVLITGSALTVYALYPPVSSSQKSRFSALSREGGFLLNSLLLSGGCAVVFMGTLYPLFLETISQTTISVGAPYYEMAFVPLMIPLLLVMAVAPLLSWQQTPKAVWQKFLPTMVIITAIPLLGVILWQAEIHVLSAFGMALGLWVIAGTAVYCWRLGRQAKGLRRKEISLLLAHGGLGLAVLGMVASSAWEKTETVALAVGNATYVAGYRFELQEMSQIEGADYTALQARLQLRQGGKEYGFLTPEKRYYAVRSTITNEVGLRHRWHGTIYAALGEEIPNTQQFGFRLSYYPLVNWIWIGLLLATLGGLLAATTARHKSS